MTINLHIMPQSLIAIDEITNTIPATDPRYNKILKVLSNGFDEDKIREILNFKDGSDKEDRIEVKLEEDTITIDKIEMPTGLRKSFLDLQRRHKPRAYLLTFWDKLQKNPSRRSIEMLFQFLEHNGHPIMADGCFIAYKAVRMDLTDHHSGTNEHKVGKILRMERKEVNPDPNETCSTGLHVCSWGYLKEFHSDDSRYFEVLVDPVDVVAVPNDYNGTKMRVCAYKIYKEIKNKRKEEKLTTQTKALQKAIKKKKK